jgi:hypothetical protein
MNVVERGTAHAVNSDDLRWRPSAVAQGVSVKDLGPEFLFVLEGELVQNGRRLGPGWASVSAVGSVDEEVYSEMGCVFVLVVRVPPSS